MVRLRSSYFCPRSKCSSQFATGGALTRHRATKHFNTSGFREREWSYSTTEPDWNGEQTTVEEGYGVGFIPERPRPALYRLRRKKYPGEDDGFEGRMPTASFRDERNANKFAEWVDRHVFRQRKSLGED